MKLSAKILEFNVRFEFTKPLLLENEERYGLTASILEKLEELWTYWEKTYKAYINLKKMLSRHK